MKHFDFLKKRVRSLATLIAMFMFFCGSLHAQTTYNIANGSLTIQKTDGDYILTGSTTNNNVGVVVKAGYKGKITFDGLSIIHKSGSVPPILIEGEYDRSNYDPITKVDIILKGTNILHHFGTSAAALQVNQGAQININAIEPSNNASGSLEAKATLAKPGELSDNATTPPGGAGIGAPNSEIAQGKSQLFYKSTEPGAEPIQYKTEHPRYPWVDGKPLYNYKTAGGNVIIGSGTITAHGGHGAGIGGGFKTWYNGVIIVTGGVVNATTGRHSAGLGSGCPTGSGVMMVDGEQAIYADKSAVIALPPCKITASGAGDGSTGRPAVIDDWALAGAKLRIYLNDPKYGPITIHTEDDEPNANIYLDLTETKGMKEVFKEVHPDFVISHVWIGKTGSDGKMLQSGWFEDETTFFTDASSTRTPETKGRPYMPVKTTTPEKGTSDVELPLFKADISFTDYPSKELVEGYTEAEAETGAFCIKIEYADIKEITNLTFKLAGDPSEFDELIFLDKDSAKMSGPPDKFSQGLKFYIVAPLKHGRPIGAYSDVVLIKGDYGGDPMGGYIRRISAQVVVRDDTDKNEHIKVTADPQKYDVFLPTVKDVELTLNINHLGAEPKYDPTNVKAKYIITTEQNYNDAVATIPIDQWMDMEVPAGDGGSATTTVSFANKPIGTYYIHWYVVSGYLMAHSKDVTDPVRDYGGFGPYNIFAGKTVTYKGNTNDGGVVPVDAKKYAVGDSVTVLGNTGHLTKASATFIGWSFDSLAVVTTQAEVPVDLLIANKKFKILTDATLYAVWATDKNGPDNKPDSIPDYLQFSVTYDGNGQTSGEAPVDNNIYSSTDLIIAKDSNTLARTGGATPIVFAGWSKTKVNDVLTSATAGSLPSDFVRSGNTFTITDNTTMHAVWSTDENKNEIPDIFENSYKVTYDGNGSTNGSVPTDATEYLINMIAIAKPHGNLERTGGATPIVFAGWAPTKVSAVLTPATAIDTTTAFVREGNPFKITGNVTMNAVWSTDTNNNTIPDIFETEYHVTYGANGATGNVPTDATKYLTGMTVTVLGNTGPLAKTNATFIGWSFKTSNLVTKPTEEPGDLIQPNAAFTIYSDTTLHAVWAQDEKGPKGGSDSIPDYLQFSVTYNGNGHTSGTAPVDNNLYSSTDLVIAKDSNTLARTGGATPIVFAGWSKTKVNDVLTSATAGLLPSDFVRSGNTFTITANTIMNAVWSTDENNNEIPDIFEDGHKVTYNDNAATTGTAPEDATTYLTGMNAIAKAKGDLTKDKAAFIGWSRETSVVGQVLTTAAQVSAANIIAVGSSFAVPTDMTLFAVWAQDERGPNGGSDSIPDYLQFSVTYHGNGDTGGTVPTDNNLYNSGNIVTLKEKGNLERDYAVFLGWNPTAVTNVIATQADENALSTTMKKEGDTFAIIGHADWHAVWAKDDNENGIPDYKEAKITYVWGMMDGPALVEIVEKNKPFTVTNKDFVNPGYVVIGWNTVNFTVVRTAAMEIAVAKVGNFYPIGGTLTPTEDHMKLYAIWAIDGDNDGYPDYGSSIVRPTSNGTRSLLLSDDATSNETITGSHVWAHGSTLYIESDKAVRASIYTIGGMLYKQMDIPEGMTSEPLKAGIYIVEMEGVRYKVVAK